MGLIFLLSYSGSTDQSTNKLIRDTLIEKTKEHLHNGAFKWDSREEIAVIWLGTNDPCSRKDCLLTLTTRPRKV